MPNFSVLGDFKSNSHASNVSVVHSFAGLQHRKVNLWSLQHRIYNLNILHQHPLS